jgi:hypothetical protein
MPLVKKETSFGQRVGNNSAEQRLDSAPAVVSSLILKPINVLDGVLVRRLSTKPTICALGRDVQRQDWGLRLFTGSSSQQRQKSRTQLSAYYYWLFLYVAFPWNPGTRPSECDCVTQ